MVYAIDAAGAIEMFRAGGVDVDAVKEIGTTDWTEHRPPERAWRNPKQKNEKEKKPWETTA